MTHHELHLCLPRQTKRRCKNRRLAFSSFPFSFHFSFLLLLLCSFSSFLCLLGLLRTLLLLLFLGRLCLQSMSKIKGKISNQRSKQDSLVMFLGDDQHLLSMFCKSLSSLSLSLETAGVSFGLLAEMLMSLGGPRWLNVITAWNSSSVCMCTFTGEIVFLYPCVCPCLFLSWLNRCFIQYPAVNNQNSFTHICPWL